MGMNHVLLIVVKLLILVAGSKSACHGGVHNPIDTKDAISSYSFTLIGTSIKSAIHRLPAGS
jgi:hypothetical protein